MGKLLNDPESVDGDLRLFQDVVISLLFPGFRFLNGRIARTDVDGTRRGIVLAPADPKGSRRNGLGDVL